MTICAWEFGHIKTERPYDNFVKFSRSPWETIETFFRERMAPCFGLQPLTIARRRGGKYPSQHDHGRLHGELGERWHQTQDFPQKMTLTFNFKLMDYQELNGILSVSLGQFRRFLYQSKALSETNSKLWSIFENNFKIWVF